MMKSKRVLIIIAAVLLGALAALFVQPLVSPRPFQEQAFDNGYSERQFSVSPNVTVWELWRGTQTTNALIAVCVFRNGKVDAIMPTELEVGDHAKAMFRVGLDRNGWFHFDKEYADLPSFLPVLRKAAQARTASEDVAWPISFGIEQNAPAERFLEILRESYPFADDGIEVMRDVDLEQVPVFGL